MGRFIDLSGQVFGRLKVLNISGITKNRHALWLCQCTCGSVKNVNSSSLRNGMTKSCGCLQKEICSEVHVKHGMRNSRLYNIWANMIKRCENPNNEQQARIYQSRGIKVCSEWHDFEIFMNWALQNGYKEDLTIV